MKKTTISIGLALMLTCSLSAKVIATSNGKDITSSEVNKVAQLFLGGKDVLSLPKAEQKRIVEMYVVQSTIIKRAKEQKLENTKLYKELMQAASDNALSNVYQERILKTIKVSDIDAQKYYNLRKEAFVIPARVQTRQMMLKTKAEANAVIKALKGLKGGDLEKKFTSLANSKSLNKNMSKAQWISLKSMPVNFAKELKSLANGTCSKEALKSEYGYHVFLKENFIAKKQLSYNEVAQDIKASLENEKFNELMAKEAKDIVSKANIKLK